MTDLVDDNSVNTAPAGSVNPVVPPEIAPPVTMTPTSAGDVSAPNTLTPATASAIGVPTAFSAVGAGSIANPTAFSSVTAGEIAAPIAKTAVTAGEVAAPVSFTPVARTHINRVLTPLIGLNFGASAYSQSGQSAALTDIVTYSRASSASYLETYRGPLGREQQRIANDYVGSVTNLVTYSEQFDDADWIANFITVRKVGDAYSLKPDSTDVSHFIQQNLNFVSGTTYTVSALVKPDGYNVLRIGFNVSSFPSSSRACIVELKNGEIIQSQSGTEISIVYEGDGYYRIGLTATANATALNGLIIQCGDVSGDDVVFSGDGVKGILIKQAQLTASAKPLPYVKTLDTAVTKSFTAKPRIEKEGYLAEGASTNLQVFSEEFDNAAYTKTDVTVTANAGLAPDETNSADRVTDNSTDGIHRILDLNTVSNATAYTMSFFVKAESIRFICLTGATTGLSVAGGVNTYFNISNGTIVSGDDGTSKIQNVGGGWYRVSRTYTSNATNAATFLLLLSEDGSTFDYVGTGKSVLVWGAQFEALPFATSYIRTEASAVSRAADDMSAAVILANGGNLTVTAKGLGSPPGVYDSVVSLSGVLSPANYIDIRSSATTANASGVCVVGGVVQAQLTSSTDSFNSILTSSLNFKSDDIEFYNNNNLLTDTSASIPILDNLNVGNYNSSTHFYGNIKQVQVFDTALTAQEVKSL